MIGLLVPTEKKFFPMLESASSNLRKMGEVLNKLVLSDSEEFRKTFTSQLKELKQHGDTLSELTLNELSTNLITPFYREDIHGLTCAIDNIADYIFAASKKMHIYKLDVFTPEIITLSELIGKSVNELDSAVCGLGNLNTKNGFISKALSNIDQFERKSDDVFNLAISNLFQSQSDAIKLIKLKEIMQVLVRTNDKCVSASNVIGSILIKYS